MQTLWLLQYNNYYNRIVKSEAVLSSYQQYQVKYKGQTTDENGNTAVVQNVNFIAGDFVNTIQVVNWAGDLPDYLLVIDEDQNIESRWFVVTAEKTRHGQLRLTLHRDLVMDYYDDLIDADMYVEKATLPESSPLIFNAEDMTFNQIKKSETLIKDASGCPWVVFYGAQNEQLTETITTSQGDVAQIFTSRQLFEQSAIYRATQNPQRFIGDPSSVQFRSWMLGITPSLQGTISISGLPLPSKIFRPIYHFSSNTFTTPYEVEQASDASPATKYLYMPNSWPYWNGYDSPLAVTVNQLNEMVSDAIPLIKAVPNSLVSDFAAAGYSVNQGDYNDCAALANQIIRVNESDGSYTYYRVICKPTTTSEISIKITDQNIMNALIRKGISMSLLADPQRTITPYNQLFLSINGYSVSLEKVTVSEVTVNISALNYTKDAPYSIYCMPYSDDLIIKNSSYSAFTQVTASKDLAMSTIKQLILKYAGASGIYDAQILPYCPLSGTEIMDNTMDLVNPDASGWAPIQTTAGVVLGYVFRVDYASFNRRIELDTPIVINNPKVENATDVYRLCSPNFNTVFEFSAAKNYGISSFAISCTYKPFTPYIKIRPDFKGLYGADFDDSRGLILGGDYSLPMTTDAWKTYELQNKNYQASFDRQIESMEISNNIARRQERWQVAAGVVSAATSGGISGSLLGGPVGGAAGAVASGALSLAGGLKDIEYNEALRREAMSLAKDQFGYQLGNIQALPIGLSKTSAYNIDNKYFPFLEYYTATNEEKLALARKIRNNGMTVGVIAKWRDFVENQWAYTIEGYEEVTDRGYFKARLISLIGLKISAHLAEAIANEFFQGVYLR